jgi:hypothetical protein
VLSVRVPLECFGQELLDVREVASGFRVLGLLLVEMSGESDDVGVDLLVTSGTALTVCRHVCEFVDCCRYS